jgi:hypothetical protein
MKSGNTRIAATRSGASRALPLKWNTRYITQINRGMVFSAGSVQRLSGKSKHKPSVRVERLEESAWESADRQTGPNLRLLWDSRLWWRHGRRRSSHYCESLSNNAELVVRQTTAGEELGAACWQGREPGSRGTSAVGRSYPAAQRRPWLRTLLCVR